MKRLGCVLQILFKLQVYISDCLGVSKVGFILILFGVSSAAVSSMYGTVVKYIPECLVLLLTGLIDIGLIIFLLVWKREPSYAAVIIFVLGWGVADAIWEVMYSGKAVCLERFLY